MTRRMKSRLSLIILVFAAVVAVSCFVASDEAYYGKTIAKVITVAQTADTESEDVNGNIEQIYKQQIQALIMNGKHKGEEISLQNITSYSQAYDLKLQKGDEVFISITENTGGKIVSADILDLKRDKYVAFITVLFILLILAVGGKKGLKSLLSVTVNSIIFAVVIGLYLNRWNLVLVVSVASILLIVASIFPVSGINKKAFSAIIGTVAGTIISLLTAAAVILATNAYGIHYEEMEFLTGYNYFQIFLVEILIGTLGGIMDIAISIASAVQEMYDKNPNIDQKALIKSGMEIGKDIMGTMANTLIFAYMSGSIPMILLLLKNGYSVFDIISLNLSLEITRALTGCIGIVISIPVTLYISVWLLGRKMIGETIKT